MNKSNKIYIAGHHGMVGSAICRQLEAQGYYNVILRDRHQLDLTNQQEVQAFFASEKPEYVFLAAAKVGGIVANNTYRAQFIYENLMIQSNVIHAAWQHGVKKLLFLGSSCIYPKMASQPLREEYLLSGPLEETNEPYAIAKIAGLKMCESYYRQYGFNYVALMPTNLYGIQDNFDLATSHVLPAILRKCHEAKEQSLPEVTLWGTGTPMREFLYVDDLADAAVYVMERNMQHFLYNVGTGTDLTIKELAETIKQVVGYTGNINWDHSKPDGTPKKQLDVHKLREEGWRFKTQLEEGIQKTYNWFKTYNIN